MLLFYFAFLTATSDGTESHINNTHGGHCADDINKVYMKLEVYVCKRSNQTYQGKECDFDLGSRATPEPLNIKKKFCSLKGLTMKGLHAHITPYCLCEQGLRHLLIFSNHGE